MTEQPQQQQQEQPMSVRAAVDTINENLSNAIPELVLLLVALQEQNRPPPPQVPEAVEAVGKAAEVLAAISDSLARDEYSEYPKIQQEIFGAAADVTSNVGTLRKSVGELSRGDYRNGYTNLMESSKVIGGTCIKVLAIVYGASFKRMDAVAEDTEAAAEQLDTHTASTDPEKFVNDLSKAATSANQLAAYIRQQADSEDSEVVKKEMRDAADRLEAASDRLIAACNAYMEDLDDPHKRQQLDDELALFRAAVADAMAPVRARQAEVAEQTAASIAATAAARPSAVPASSRSGCVAVPQRQPASRARVETSAAAGATPAEAALLAEADRQREATATLVDVVRAGGRPAEAVAAAREIAQRQPAIVAEARRNAEQSGDAQHAREVAAACDELETLLPQVLAETKRALQDPRACDDLARKTAAMDAALARACAPAAAGRSPARGLGDAVSAAPRVAERSAAEEALDDLEALVRAVGRGAGQPQVDVLAARLEERCRELHDPAVDAALAAVLETARRDPAATPAAAETLRAALRGREYHMLTKDQAEALEELDALVRAVQRNAARSEVDSALARLADRCAGAGGDVPASLTALETAVHGPDAAHDAPPAAERVRAAITAGAMPAGTRLPERDTARALSDTDALVRAVETGAAPAEVSALAAVLVDDCAAVGDRDVDRALEDLLRAARTDPSAVPAAGARLKAALRAAGVGSARAEAAVRSVLPALEETVRRVDPGDAEAVRRAAEEAAVALDAIASEMRVDPEEQVAVDAERLVEGYGFLPVAAANGDRKGVVEGARALADEQPRVLADARACAARDGDRELEEELAEIQRTLDPLLTKQLSATKSLVEEPENVEKRADCDRNARAARTALCGLRDAVCPVPEVVADEGRDDVKETMVELQRALAAGDVVAARKALDKLLEQLREMREANRRAALASDPAKAKEALAALSRLDALIADLQRAHESWEREPQNAQLREAEERKLREVGDALAELDRLLDVATKAAAERERHALDMMAAASDRRDAAAAVAHAKEAMGAQQRVLERARALSERLEDPEAKRRTEQVAAEIEALLPQAMGAMKEALKAPSSDNDDELHDAVQELKDKLSELEGLCDAGTPKGDTAAAIARAHGAATALTRAARANDKEGAVKAAASARAACEDLKKQEAARPGGWEREPRSVRDLIGKFEGLASQASDAAAGVGSGPQANKRAEEAGRAMHEPLDNLSEQLGSARAPEAQARSRIRGSAAQARKGAAASGRKNDLDALTRAIRDLADQLGRFSGVAREAAVQGSKEGGQGSAALELLELIRALESGAPQAAAPKARDVEKIFEKLDGPRAEAAGREAQQPRSEVAEVITRVAEEIEEAAARHKKEVANAPQLSGFDVGPLVEAMNKLADAAREGRRQQLLVTGREIGAYVAQLCKELQKVADRCKDPVYHDKITRSLQALRNFSVQLKIVSAVKAASREGESNDADEQIKSVVTSLGRALSESLTAVQITKKAGLLK
eukprot:m51a1_g5284 hypothetical protein (1501) ;mRNA; r:182333-188861